MARRAFDGDVAPAAAPSWARPRPRRAGCRIDPGEPDVVLSRLDAFLTADGPRFIEINSDAPAGFGYGDRMAEVFGELPVFRAFAAARGRRLRALGPGPRRRRARRVADGAEAPATPRVAIVDWAEVKTRADQEILRAVFEAARLRLRPRRSARDGASATGGCWPAAGAVDVVYRRAVLSELVEREAEVRAFLEAYRERARRLRELLPLPALGGQGLLRAPHRRGLRRAADRRRARVRRPRRALDPQGRGAPHAAGRARVDLVPHVLENRDGLVLKPAHGYGGRSVFVGDETEPAVWEARCGRARRALGGPGARDHPEEAVSGARATGRLAFAS